MRLRQVALALTLAAASLGAASSVAQEAPTPPRTTVLKPDSASLDLGTVAAGDLAVATFVLKNPSDRVVKIVRAKPS